MFSHRLPSELTMTTVSCYCASCGIPLLSGTDSMYLQNRQRIIHAHIAKLTCTIGQYHMPTCLPSRNVKDPRRLKKKDYKVKKNIHTQKYTCTIK